MTAKTHSPAMNGLHALSIFRVIRILGLAALGLAAWMAMRYNREARHCLHDSLSSPEQRRVRDIVSHALDEASRKDEAAFRVFRRQLVALREACGTARAGIDDFLDDATSMRGTATLTGLMVYDRVRHTHRAETFLHQALDRHIKRPCVEAEKQAAAALEQLQTRLKENSVQAATATLAALDPAATGRDTPAPEEFERLRETLVRADPASRTIAASTAWSVTGLAVGIPFSPELYAVVRRVLGKVAARFVAKSVAVSGLPLADGPLPVGDIAWGSAEAGFIAWDCHTLYKARVTIRRDLRRKLERGLDDFTTRLTDRTDRAGRRLLREFQKQRQNTLAKICTT